VKLGAERTLGRLPNAERKRLGSGAVLENLNQGVRVARMTPHLRDRQRTEFSQRYPNENALTELAVRISLSGRLCDAGCNTTLPQCLRNANRATQRCVQVQNALANG
jgi:hypothetical protein